MKSVNVMFSNVRVKKEGYNFDCDVEEYIRGVDELDYYFNWSVSGDGGERVFDEEELKRKFEKEGVVVLDGEENSIVIGRDEKVDEVVKILMENDEGDNCWDEFEEKYVLIGKRKDGKKDMKSFIILMESDDGKGDVIEKIKEELGKKGCKYMCVDGDRGGVYLNGVCEDGMEEVEINLKIKLRLMDVDEEGIEYLKERSEEVGWG